MLLMSTLVKKKILGKLQLTRFDLDQDSDPDPIQRVPRPEVDQDSNSVPIQREKWK